MADFRMVRFPYNETAVAIRRSAAPNAWFDRDARSWRMSLVEVRAFLSALWRAGLGLLAAKTLIDGVAAPHCAEVAGLLRQDRPETLFIQASWASAPYRRTVVRPVPPAMRQGRPLLEPCATSAIW